MALVKGKARAARRARGAHLPHGQAKDKISRDGFTVEFFQVTHSIVTPLPWRSKLPLGTSFPHRDFQDRSNTDGPEEFDLHTAGSLRRSGRNWPFSSDSTNAEHGRVYAVRALRERSLRVDLRTSKGRIILRVSRLNSELQLVVDQAKQYGRIVSFLDAVWWRTRTQPRSWVSEDPRTHHPIEGHSELSTREGLRRAGGCQGEP